MLSASASITGGTEIVGSSVHKNDGADNNLEWSFNYSDNTLQVYFQYNSSIIGSNCNALCMVRYDSI